MDLKHWTNPLRSTDFIDARNKINFQEPSNNENVQKEMVHHKQCLWTLSLWYGQFSNATKTI